MSTTIQRALDQAIEQLTQAQLPTSPDYHTARLDAQVLLSHVLHVERSTLYTYPERALTSEQGQRYFSLIQRRAQGAPVAYLTGYKEFYGLDFLVDERVLIPRPETELLVEAALQVCRAKLDAGHTPVVADIGTGSGVIPITLAVHEPRLPYLYATDISSGTLAVASLNCQQHHVEQRVRLLQGDLLAPLPEPVDVLTANLPYIGLEEMDMLDVDVRDYEPHVALFSGAKGLDLLERLLTDLARSHVLSTGAVVLLEIGYLQRLALTHMVETLLPQAKITFLKDYASWDRVLQVNLNG